MPVVYLENSIVEENYYFCFCTCILAKNLQNKITLQNILGAHKKFIFDAFIFYEIKLYRR